MESIFRFSDIKGEACRTLNFQNLVNEESCDGDNKTTAFEMIEQLQGKV